MASNNFVNGDVVVVRADQDYSMLKLGQRVFIKNALDSGELLVVISAFADKILVQNSKGEKQILKSDRFALYQHTAQDPVYKPQYLEERVEQDEAAGKPFCHGQTERDKELIEMRLATRKALRGY